jgi:transposase
MVWKTIFFLLVAPRNIIWDPFGPTVTCASTGYVSPGREQPRAKKRAVVAVARKPAVLLLTLWKSREPYESFHTMV